MSLKEALRFEKRYFQATFASVPYTDYLHFGYRYIFLQVFLYLFRKIVMRA